MTKQMTWTKKTEVTTNEKRLRKHRLVVCWKRWGENKGPHTDPD